MLRILVISYLLLLSLYTRAQTTDTTQVRSINSKIKVSGKISEARTGALIPGVIVIQKGVGGSFVKGDGSFSMTIKKTDTLLVSAFGYRVQKFAFADSTGKSFNITVKLSKLEKQLADAIVMPKRVLSEVHEDLEELRLKLPQRTTGVDALSSPITAIYEAFSKKARAKAEVAKLEHRDQKHALLKELFRLYVDADIINLSEAEFENFILFSNVSDDFLRSATEYELVVFFQSRYEEYVALKQ